MNDNYLDEVLPRWQFWKEYLIEQLKNYKKTLEEEWSLSDEAVEKIEKMNAEMIEKVKEIKSRTDLEKIRNEISEWMENLNDCCDQEGVLSTGVSWVDVDDKCKLSSWLGITNFLDAMNEIGKTNKKITK